MFYFMAVHNKVILDPPKTTNHNHNNSTLFTSVSAASCTVSVTSRPVRWLRILTLWLTTVLSGSQNFQAKRRTERSHWLTISFPSRGDTKWGLVITSGGVGSTENKRYQWDWKLWNGLHGGGLFCFVFWQRSHLVFWQRSQEKYQFARIRKHSTKIETANSMMLKVLNQRGTF